ncbi:orotate phosphoribosyltransferase [Jaminaea rosea]|uniref:orotate phosphoribosyltransferase n=1 Tax=Jaminaea rosea TaxID=1569628 RepID=A0A316UWP6_9BASI|nr:orotate phosphoribosyltransferase [Jaminaea rosea]PWN28751.1 orotate phosphoribosyltransferase [Jaminaea rosea]
MSSSSAQVLPHQKSYLDLLLASNILAFKGPYTLKSGRKSPYFFNAGLFNSGAKVAELARCYAEEIVRSGLLGETKEERENTVLFGPAYKGIPLATGVSLSLSLPPHSLDLGFCFNRKEKKDHGEGGTLVGAPMKGKRVIILDDVITAGTAINEAVDIIKAEGGQLVGIVIALDRQEKVKEGDETSAVGAVQQRLGTKVVSVVNLNQVIAFLEGKGMSNEVEGMKEYRQRYGVVEPASK